METITRDLRGSSAGLVSFSFKLNIGSTIQTKDAPTPLAIWITGSGPESPSTDVLSFTANDPTSLRPALLENIFNLVRRHLIENTSHNPAPEAAGQPMIALDSNITRLLWNQFGNSLKNDEETTPENAREN